MATEIVIATIGAAVIKLKLAVLSFVSSFTKSFRPSLNAWSSPRGPTLLGPLRK